MGNDEENGGRYHGDTMFFYGIYFMKQISINHEIICIPLSHGFYRDRMGIDNKPMKSTSM